MKKTIVLFFIILSSFALFAEVADAQTVSLSPVSQPVQRNADFSLIINVASVTNLFGVAFDLDFDPALLDFVSASEGGFLNQGCQTSLMASENPPGKLIFGYSRLGVSCGGVSGSGTLATLNFRSLSQEGTANFSFSKNKLCLLSGNSCNYIIGTWNGASVTVGVAADTTPPAAPWGVIVI